MWYDSVADVRQMASSLSDISSKGLLSVSDISFNQVSRS